MKLTIDLEQEEDERWIGEAVELPGVLAYGQTREEAIMRVQALAFCVVADRLDQGERMTGVTQICLCNRQLSIPGYERLYDERHSGTTSSPI